MITKPLTNISIEKKENGSIEFSDYEPETLKRTPFVTIDSTSIYYPIFNDAFTGNTVKRETVYQKVGSAVVPKTGLYTFSEAVTSGLSSTDAASVTLSMGYSLTIKAGSGILPVESTHQISTNLTTSFNHSITVTEQRKQTQTLSSGTPSAAYTYDKFCGATYQLHSNYNVQPGNGLKTLLQKNNAVLAKTSFKYAENDFYLAVTPGAES